MMIHDFDMVRYVTGSEAVEISAVGSCLVNPNLQEESGIPDVDTAVVTMKMANGCIAVINNSRQAVYGYDQRVEAFGSKGMASDANDLLNTTTVLTKDGAHLRSRCGSSSSVTTRHSSTRLSPSLMQSTTIQRLLSALSMVCVRFSWLRLLPSPAVTAAYTLRLRSNFSA